MKPNISTGRIIKKVSGLLPEKIIDYSLADQGADHVVVLVKCAGANSFVVKVGPEANVDSYVLKRLFPKSIKVPKIIAESFIESGGIKYPLVIMTFLEGKLLRSLTSEKRIDFIEPVLDEIKKVHSLFNSKKAGLLADIIKGRGFSWKEYLKRDLRGETEFFDWEEICQRKGVEKNLIQKALKVILKQVEEIPEDRPIVLLHGDLNDSNVFVEDNQLEGIIDWSDALYGDPLFDFARFRMNIDHQIGNKGVKVYYEALNLSDKLLDLEKLYFLFHVLVYVNWYSFEKEISLVQRHMRILQKFL